MKRLTIIGAGGHGKVVAETAEMDGYDDIVFRDDAYPEKQKNGPWLVVGRSGEKGGDGPVFLAIGQNRIRSRMWEDLLIEDSPVLQHPSAIFSKYAKVSAGSLVAAGSIVNAGVIVGKAVILNTGCSVDHDCRVADFVHISPGARLAGNVSIGARSWVGIGAVVREGITIGKDVTIAAGAVVIKDVPNGQTVSGVPAKVMEKR